MSRVDLRNMLAADEAGALILPASPSFYMRPTCVQDVVDSVVGRVLDHLGVAHDLEVRWSGKAIRAGKDDADTRGAGEA